MIQLLNKLQNLLELGFKIDFIAPLLLRLYLVPVFWMAGTQKLGHFQDTVDWFGNPDWGLGLPFPLVMATMAVAAEVGGAILLTLGLATRWISIPLMFTMLVAAVSVHLQNGWLAISTASGPFATERTIDAIDKLDRIKSILQQHGNYEWLTESGSVVILNNGIEFAATYLVMLLALFALGGGRYISVDYWLAKRFRDNNIATS
ncbi:DoxX family protein [Halieaceae bacterium IMCC14734]|uniref:DoxX family protein n=1 Tax=Candidatus Litorirhabdus singularis TaxID=2518993 RepID=A0ABT3TJM7_9GAMM|nr:DoxX family protein [Candidatus Litorirhabdus singularis]MCX2982518.1 DoxX family protein [Candidatus Litorirhabdus singularis]